ncbi:hypothetical protein BDEG_24752 [Batrachochytrium dendrobatidis JEL423]|uniref:Uncharacterized protein n=1 Tax=Batrachochytrium dendrobatidis (strain JEL423) TaxID=403673 RepID=A0A177WMS7_BATDL|nr:hypothetical protein BDEG_24752 [Batrachochytrium dendrobatidis JEL423]
MDRTGQEQGEISSVDKFCDMMLMPCIYVIGQDMLCGNHQVMELYRNIIKHVMAESLFGVIECDITVPNQLWNVFAEMPPIFNNVGLVFNDICAEPQDWVNPNYKCNKLIGSFFGNKVLFHTELLKCVTHCSMHSWIMFRMTCELEIPIKPTHYMRMM